MKKLVLGLVMFFGLCSLANATYLFSGKINVVYSSDTGLTVFNLVGSSNANNRSDQIQTPAQLPDCKGDLQVANNPMQLAQLLLAKKEHLSVRIATEDSCGDKSGGAVHVQGIYLDN